MSLAKKRAKKGIIFTLDAIIAILVAASFILASFFYLSKATNVPYDRQGIYDLSLDSLAVLEKKGDLAYSVENGSNSTLVEFLNFSLSQQVCGEIKIFNTDTFQLLTATKPGCTPINETSFARRVFIANNSKIYYAEMEVWFK
ncbi:MAG: hypothetical protein D6797_07230 [Bdellovibrio sp.]|nr:MAG: hypothetical protein D6797_07230 [Bdellovibrio sp.]